MKVYKYILSAAIIWGGLMSSCTDEWDNHYNKQAAVINNEEMTIVDAPAIEYLEHNNHIALYAICLKRQESLKKWKLPEYLTPFLSLTIHS